MRVVKRDPQVELAALRIGQALEVLNKALEDAQILGLRTEVEAIGPSERHTVQIILLNPVELKTV